MMWLAQWSTPNCKSPHYSEKKVKIFSLFSHLCCGQIIRMLLKPSRNSTLRSSFTLSFHYAAHLNTLDSDITAWLSFNGHGNGSATNVLFYYIQMKWNGCKHSYQSCETSLMKNKFFNLPPINFPFKLDRNNNNNNNEFRSFGLFK